MKRLFAILLSLLIVGAPTAAGMLVTYRQAQARVAAERSVLLQAQTEGEALRAQLDNALALANEKAREEAERILEEQREAQRKKEEEAKKAATPRGPAAIDLSYWQGLYPDVVGYIYNPGTAISYPIVYGNTDFYMSHNLDGQEDVNGSIVLSIENSPSFTGNNSLIHGHNMKSGAMFASLQYDKSHDFYLSHPCMYLYTPTQNYRVDLFAGFPTPHDGEVYCTGLTDDQISRFKAQSTFSSDVWPSSGHILTLSTCSYEHDNWRYVVLGDMVPIS